MATYGWTYEQLRTELARYESELHASGKRRVTIDTYVGQSERFLRFLVGAYRPDERPKARRSRAGIPPGPTVTIRPDEILGLIALEVLVDPEAEDAQRQEGVLYDELLGSRDELQLLIENEVRGSLPGGISVVMGIERGSLTIKVHLIVVEIEYQADFEELMRNLQRAARGVGNVVGSLSRRLRRGLPITIVVTVTFGPPASS